MRGGTYSHTKQDPMDAASMRHLVDAGLACVKDPDLLLSDRHLRKQGVQVIANLHETS